MTRAITILLAAVATLSACAIVEPGDDRNRAELERYWTTWQARGSEDYQYVQRRLCYCAAELVAPVRLTVRDGAVTDRAFVDSDLPVPLGISNVWGTVEDLFRLIDNALNNDAASLIVTYHPRLGYPTHISIDYDFATADDELTVTVSSLQVLNSSNQ